MSPNFHSIVIIFDQYIDMKIEFFMNKRSIFICGKVAKYKFCVWM